MPGVRGAAGCPLVLDVTAAAPGLSPGAQPTPAAIRDAGAGRFVLSGSWTALGIGSVDQQFAGQATAAQGELEVDGSAVEALDTVGVWVLQRLLERLRAGGSTVRLAGWAPQFARLLDLVAQRPADRAPAQLPPQGSLERIGRATMSGLEQGAAMLAFVGESAIAFAGTVLHPGRLRLRTTFSNIQNGGFNALPIVGMLAFLLGIVVAYQAADQLRRYGANIFVADLVGISMLREFAPLITAIIVAGRSGSAYAAQIGTMTVTEEIDAMRTLGISPLEQLVLPKFIALVIALPLLTMYADAVGVFGGMVMARGSLGVGYHEFLERFVHAVEPHTFLVGIAKAPVFAAIIAIVGCFQGFRTKGGADSVGRQTTRAVVHAIFLVIVADALFSILFSMLDL